jgi:hypothetical protein
MPDERVIGIMLADRPLRSGAWFATAWSPPPLEGKTWSAGDKFITCARGRDDGKKGAVFPPSDV